MPGGGHVHRGCAVKRADQNVGPEGANDSDHVSKRDVVAVPLFPSFRRALGKSNRDARKALSTP